MSSLHAVILAGGSGTRFWPLSRRARPKQFLTLFGKHSLLQDTSERVRALIPPERWWVSCGRGHAEAVKDHLPELAASQLLLEPSARNTAPAVALACLRIAELDPEATLVVLPADHHVVNRAAFLEALRCAAREADQGAVVTLGIRPTRPETGYGYLQLEEAPEHFRGDEAATLQRFVEKPKLEAAKRMVEGGRHLWNAGIFVFKARLMIDAMERLRPATIAPLLALQTQDKLQEEAALGRAWKSLESISLDFGVMEALEQIRCVPVDCGWSDLGSFASLGEHHPQDESGCVLLGDALNVGSTGCIVEARAGRNVTLVGVEDLVVVDAGDSLLITRRGHEQAVREAVLALAHAGREELL